MLFLSPEGAPSGPQKNDSPAPAPEKPVSPAVVQKTQIHTPRELELEKRVAVIEDRVDGVCAWVRETNDFLAGAGVRPPGPARLQRPRGRPRKDPLAGVVATGPGPAAPLQLDDDDDDDRQDQPPRGPAVNRPAEDPIAKELGF